MSVGKKRREVLRSCVGEDHSSLLDVDEQLELTIALLDGARKFRDLTLRADRADIRREAARRCA